MVFSPDAPSAPGNASPDFPCFWVTCYLSYYSLVFVCACILTFQQLCTVRYVARLLFCHNITHPHVAMLLFHHHITHPHVQFNVQPEHRFAEMFHLLPLCVHQITLPRCLRLLSTTPASCRTYVTVPTQISL